MSFFTYIRYQSGTWDKSSRTLYARLQSLPWLRLLSTLPLFTHILVYISQKKLIKFNLSIIYPTYYLLVAWPLFSISDGNNTLSTRPGRFQGGPYWFVFINVFRVSSWMYPRIRVHMLYTIFDFECQHMTQKPYLTTIVQYIKDVVAFLLQMRVHNLILFSWMSVINLMHYTTFFIYHIFSIQLFLIFFVDGCFLY